MITQEINEIYNNLWSSLEQERFPISAKEISAFSYVSDEIKYFLFAEIETYCKVLVSKIIDQNLINQEIKESDDYSHILELLFDWINLDKGAAQKILLLAIKTKINYIFAPTETLSGFVFMNSTVKDISEIIENLKFFETDNFIQTIQNELLELQNSKNELEITEFNDIIKDILINVSQEQSIENFLQPLNSYLLFAQKDTINLELLISFFISRDLSGISNEIRNFATENAIQDFSAEQIISLLEQLFDVSDNKNEEAVEDTSAGEFENSEEIEENTSAVEMENNEALEETSAVEFENSEVMEENTSAGEIENYEAVEENTSAGEIENSEVMEENTSAGEMENSEEIEENNATEMENYEEIEETSAGEIENYEEMEEDSAVEFENSEALEENSATEMENYEVVEENSAVEIENNEVVEDTSAVEIENYEEVEENTSAVEMEENSLNNNILQVITQMRQEKKTPYEIELEYLRLEKINIEQFRERIMNS